MSDLEQRYYEDRALRDAARVVLMADFEHTKSTLSPNALVDRVTGRIGDGARDVFDTAKAQADDHRGIIAALIGAILIWLGREPLLEALGLAEDDETGGEFDKQSNPTGDPHADQPHSGDDHEQ